MLTSNPLLKYIFVVLLPGELSLKESETWLGILGLIVPPEEQQIEEC